VVDWYFFFYKEHLINSVEKKPASSLVLSLRKTLNGTPSPLRSGQVVHQ